MKNILKDIIKYKLHIGHLKKFRNIYMNDYIINVKNNIDIINPYKILYNLRLASKNLTICSKIGGEILYFGNKIIFKDLVKKYAKINNMPFINDK